MTPILRPTCPDCALVADAVEVLVLAGPLNLLARELRFLFARFDASEDRLAHRNHAELWPWRGCSRRRPTGGDDVPAGRPSDLREVTSCPPSVGRSVRTNGRRADRSVSARGRRSSQ